MLVKAKTLKNYKLRGIDGEIGHVEEFYFDDHHWVIRYLVANTGNWLTGRQVLISPYVLSGIDKENQHIEINLTKKQIEDSPSLDTDKPVSHQFEDDYTKYHGIPMYWGGPYMWGSYPYIVRDRENWEEPSTGNAKRDHHLRSTQMVGDYDIQATDGKIGSIDDFILDDEKWAIRYLIVATKEKKVLVSPEWIERVSWSQSKVFVSFPGEIIMRSPEFTKLSLLTGDDEIALHQYYNRKGYWVNEPDAKEHSR